MRVKNRFFKGHGLGNDYIAVDPEDLDFRLTPGNIRKICDRNWGVGSDGILALHRSRRADFGLRIYNPDGSEAEKSGTGCVSSGAIFTPRGSVVADSSRWIRREDWWRLSCI